MVMDQREKKLNNNNNNNNRLCTDWRRKRFCELSCSWFSVATGPSHTMAVVGDGSSSGLGGTLRSKEADGDPWRKLSATDLRANTVVFPAQKQVKLPEYVRALEQAGFDAAEILSIQVSTSGQCRLTLSQASIASRIISTGFRIGEETIFPEFFSANSNDNSLQLHIHDVPVWVADCAISGALAQYGTVQGNIRHGKFQVRDGVFVASGVRFATFKPKQGVTSIPSSVRSSDGRHSFRVFHNGQQPTCYRCGSPYHIAAKCPDKPEKSRTTAPSIIADTSEVMGASHDPSSPNRVEPASQPAHVSYSSAVRSPLLGSLLHTADPSQRNEVPESSQSPARALSSTSSAGASARQPLAQPKSHHSPTHTRTRRPNYAGSNREDRSDSESSADSDSDSDQAFESSYESLVVDPLDAGTTTPDGRPSRVVNEGRAENLLTRIAAAINTPSVQAPAPSSRKRKGDFSSPEDAAAARRAKKKARKQRKRETQHRSQP